MPLKEKWAQEPALSAPQAMIARAQEAERSGHWGVARAQYEAVIRDPSTPDGLRLASMRWLGRAYLETGNRAAALDVLEAAVTAGNAAGDYDAVAQTINVIAIVEQRGGNLERAADLYVEARKQAVAAGDKALVAMIDQNAGTVANIRGDVTAALDSFRMSLAGYQAVGLSRYSGQVLNNMGLALVEIGDLASAEAAYTTALRELAAHGDQTLMDEVVVNQIQLAISMRRFDEAMEKSQRLMSAPGAESMPWIGEVHRHIGVIARELSDLRLANESLARAAEIAAKSEDLLLSADVAEQQAELCYLEERHADMLKCLNQARSIYSRMNAVTRIAEVERRNSRLEGRFLAIAKQWGDSIEGADRYTQGHCERVANIAGALADRAGISARDAFWFRLGALLHDVGKIIVPPSVLNKAGPLTSDEWELMKKHPVAGLELVAGVDFPGDVTAMIRSHHERWDGKGYPDGLVGETTPLPARILCIADVYDALTTSRPYRHALDHAEGVALMRSSTGQFDPDLMEIFLSWSEDEEARRCA